MVEGSTIMPMGSSTYQYGGDYPCIDPDGGVIRAVKNCDTLIGVDVLFGPLPLYCSKAEIYGIPISLSVVLSGKVFDGHLQVATVAHKALNRSIVGQCHLINWVIGIVFEYATVPVFYVYPVSGPRHPHISVNKWIRMCHSGDLYLIS